MANEERDTIVKTFVQITYSLPQGPSGGLIRREVHRVKDDASNDFVVVIDKSEDVGRKDDWRDYLSDQVDSQETKRDDAFDRANDSIELLQDQINEIDSL